MLCVCPSGLQTSRNNNSSRFGKFIELCYSADGYIDGAHIDTYLLETIRVTAQLPGERNFHVFYEVLAGLSEAKREAWDCPSPQAFRLLSGSGEFQRHDGETDEGNFKSLQEALRTVHMDAERIEEVCRLVVGILHIGNLSFESSGVVGEEAAVFSPTAERHVQGVCRLLGLSESALLSAVARRSICVAGSTIEKTLSVDAAGNASDVLARTCYDLLFRSLLQQINKALRLDPTREEAASFIGVLDIFGFEYFDNNSFEQLCINYANEKLQDHFNFAIFQSEQEVYEEEGLKWVFKDYPNNAERLELFEHKRTGLFMLCDEQLKVPKPEDDKLVKSFYAKCVSHRFFSASRGDRGRQDFVVNHFACDVKYNIAGFVDKNRNEVAVEIFAALESSSSALVRSLPLASADPRAWRTTREGGEGLSSDSCEDGVATASSGPVHRAVHAARSARNVSASVGVGRRSSSVASIFSAQLNDLIRKIRATRSHFIRCIKPNELLAPNCFDISMVLSQLRCGGALGAVQVGVCLPLGMHENICVICVCCYICMCVSCRLFPHVLMAPRYRSQVFHAGFPNRMDFKSFVSRYSAFFVVCGVNSLTKDLQECIERARRSDSDDLWRICSSLLVDIVSLTAIVLNMTEEAEAAEHVDVQKGLQRGKTQVFLRAPVFELLERLHVRSLTLIARRLQRRFRQIRARHSRQRPSAKSAAANCVMFFAFKRRFQARKCVSAILLLQRRVRVFLAVRKRRRILTAFTRLKAHFRGRKARAYVRGIRNRAAALIQTVFRRRRAHRKYLHMQWAALRAQTMVRCWLAFRRRRKVLWLCSTLQRLWRGSRARQHAHARRQKLVSARVYMN